MFNREYYKLTVEERIECLAWEIEMLAAENDKEIHNLALKMKIIFFEREHGTIEEIMKEHNKKVEAAK